MSALRSALWSVLWSGPSAARRAARPWAPGRAVRVLVIVQNLPVPLDRRVWLECRALVAAGYGVSVICPKGPGDPSRQEIEGVRIYKYAAPKPAVGALGYLREFVYCWLRTALLSLVVAARDGFSIIQACNPPDTYWALARLYRPFGVRFVYDQHDLNPEVFRSRFGDPRGARSRLQYRMLCWLERRTYRAADHVVSTNESYRRIAVERGGLAPHQVTVVRSGPDTTVMRPFDSDPSVKRGRENLLAYLGIMGPQDGVDIVLRALDVIVHQQGREDVGAVLLGFGDSYDDLVALTHELRLDDYVTFTGRVGPAEIGRYLSAATVGLCPDPSSPLNDVSTMNKTMEYMSYALPVVSFDLPETIVSGGAAVDYVEHTGRAEADVEAFAKAVIKLVDDPARRAEMGLAGRRRAEGVLDWVPQKLAYVGVYDALSGRADAAAPALADAAPPEYVDLTDDAAVRRFARTRRVRGDDGDDLGAG